MYMIIKPARWLRRLMQLTSTEWSFQLFMIALGALYFCTAWVSEKHVFQRLARTLGRVKQEISKQSKKRKQYKIILEEMRV